MKKVGEQGESRTCGRCGSVCAPPYTETAVQGAAGTGTHPYTETEVARQDRACVHSCRIAWRCRVARTVLTWANYMHRSVRLELGHCLATTLAVLDLEIEVDRSRRQHYCMDWLSSLTVCLASTGWTVGEVLFQGVETSRKTTARTPAYDTRAQGPGGRARMC